VKSHVLVLHKQQWHCGRGSNCRQSAGRAQFNPKLWCQRLHHHRTFRGHLHAVYIVAVDPTGRYVLTGSDDHVVKIWCARTGVLQSSCCGHVVCSYASYNVLYMHASSHLMCAYASSHVVCTHASSNLDRLLGLTPMVLRLGPAYAKSPSCIARQNLLHDFLFPALSRSV
jgi:WD40 repeat protein